MCTNNAPRRARTSRCCHLGHAPTLAPVEMDRGVLAGVHGDIQELRVQGSRGATIVHETVLCLMDYRRSGGSSVAWSSPKELGRPRRSGGALAWRRLKGAKDRDLVLGVSMAKFAGEK